MNLLSMKIDTEIGTNVEPTYATLIGALGPKLEPKRKRIYLMKSSAERKT